LHGEAFTKILQTVSPYFDWIVIDSPPVLPLADAPAMARQVDGCLLVVRAERTPREAVDAAMETLGTKHVLGVILNGVDGVGRLYSKYRSYDERPSTRGEGERRSGPDRQRRDRLT
jgi:Mrp family chromosome partitioning ATPase